MQVANVRVCVCVGGRYLQDFIMCMLFLSVSEPRLPCTRMREQEI